jgi:hypothetical protein
VKAEWTSAFAHAAILPDIQPRPWISAARAMPSLVANPCSPYRIGILLFFHHPACITALYPKDKWAKALA